MDKPMMKCGHGANGKNREGLPICAICIGFTGLAEIETNAPNLSNRTAKCTYCKTTKSSSTDLPFFEYRGSGSREAVDSCVCGFFKAAHQHDNNRVNSRSVTEDGRCKTGFVAKGPGEYDLYYCGCRGWD